jgi:hypothetical protein
MLRNQQEQEREPVTKNVIEDDDKRVGGSHGATAPLTRRIDSFDHSCSSVDSFDDDDSIGARSFDSFVDMVLGEEEGLKAARPPQHISMSTSVITRPPPRGESVTTRVLNLMSKPETCPSKGLPLRYKHSAVLPGDSSRDVFENSAVSLEAAMSTLKDEDGVAM